MARIVGQRLWSLADGEPLGVVIDSCHGPHGWMLLVAGDDGRLASWPASNVSLAAPDLVMSRGEPDAGAGDKA